MRLNPNPSTPPHTPPRIRTTTVESARPQGSHQNSPLCSGTTPELPHILPVFNEIDLRDDALRAYLHPSQIFPPLRVPTPEALSVSSLPNSFGSTLAHTLARPGFEALSSNAVCIKYGSDGAVEAATLAGLVERLILDSNDFRKDIEFREMFVIAYRAFSTAEEVFRQLLERFEAVSSPQYTRRQGVSVRHSVLTVLELWLVRNHVEAKDIPLLQQMRAFAISIQASTFRDFSPRLIELIDRNVDMFQYPVPALSPSSSSPTLNLPVKPSDFSPEEIALVLASIEGARYQMIIDSDCIGWLEGIHDSNMISTFITENIKLSYWVQKSILKSSAQSQRSTNFKYFIRIVKECLKLRNFSSAFALFQGLTSTSITGLKRTCTADTSSAKILVEAGKLLSPDKDFQTYRKALNAFKTPRVAWLRKAPSASTEPCVPWLDVHLHDLMVVHQEHPKFVEEDGHTNLINFERYRYVHDEIRQVRSYQDPPLKLEPKDGARHAGIQTFVEAELRSLVIDDALHAWLQERGNKLTLREKADYHDLGEERVAAGLTRRTTITTRPKPPRASSSASRSILSPQASPITPHGEAAPPLLQPPDILNCVIHEEQGQSALPSIDLTHDSLSVTSAEISHQIPDAEFAGYDPLLLGAYLHRLSAPNYEDAFKSDSDRCLNRRITRVSPHPVACGGFADVRVGFFGEQKVAIKTIRSFQIESSRLRKRLWREYTTWTRISHPNVLECLGFSYDFSPPPHDIPSLISPWMSNGALDTYLEKYPDTDRLELLVAVAEGLSFLHGQRPVIIHGDLKAANILISNSGQPRLSDFGLSRILKLEGMTATSGTAGSVRWMSPELLRGHTIDSASSDVWAYGMTVLEILSGKLPYCNLPTEAIVITQIINSELPSRPQDMKVSSILTDKVWAICQLCWNIDPELRPSMHKVLSTISRLTR